MQNRPLGPFSVANVALGCMNFCHAYGNPVSTEQSHAVLHAALDAGQADTAFFENKIATGRYYMARQLPITTTHLARIRSGAEPVMALTAEQF